MLETIRACVPRPRVQPPPHAAEMALLKAEVWAPGATLRLAFRFGTRAQRRAVMVAAETWMRYANVRIVQVAAGPAELRCAFDPGGSWSYVGRDALSIPADQPTLNMGWDDDPGRDLHELGHALGCIHEHQWGAIPWNRPACYAYYGGPPNFWSRRDVDEQVLDREPAGLLVTTSQWDRTSIMEYPIPAALVTDPGYACGWNQRLSAADVAMIRRMYPPTPAPTGRTMIHESEPLPPFDEGITRAIPASPIAPAPPPAAEPFATPPAKEPFLANPLKLAPTGSGPGHVSRADLARSVFFGSSIYGILQMVSPMVLQLLTQVGPDGHPFVTHGDLFAEAFSACIAAAVAITHVVSAFMRDNRPATDATPDVAPGRLP